MRIGAENSTCAHFRKSFFVFGCCENAFFLRVSARTKFASGRGRERRNGCSTLHNAVILGAKSPLSACFRMHNNAASPLTAVRAPHGICSDFR
jgi:hypothetical protein